MSVAFFYLDFCIYRLDQRIEVIDTVVRVQLAQRRNRNDGDRGGRFALKLIRCDVIFCEKVIVVVEVIGIITTLAKVLILEVVIVGAVPEADFPTIEVEVVVSKVDYSKNYHRLSFSWAICFRPPRR